MIRLTPPTVVRRVSSAWGKPRKYRGGWHGGLDFPAKRGSPALAMAGGTIARVNHDPSGSGHAGKYVVINHGAGVHTRLIHMDTVEVTRGQRVQRGQRIGTIGSTGTHSGVSHGHADVKLSPSALQEYERRFGKPTTGWYRDMPPWGRGAPMEAIMDGAVYDPGVLESALALGVKPFKPSSWVVPVGLSLVAFFVVRAASA